ncbi:MAG: TrkH family potassium uptake protein [Peptococcaceae bacterium]|nr:TrkH family potassium uptake protein [Peptococcaceae bacterium]
MPFALQPGARPDFLTALFTATSAVCVTGLVVVDTGTHWSLAGQIIILVLIQVGGLGFMTMATLFSILMGRRINLRERLLIKEALNQINVEGVVRLARYVLFFTFGTELLFALVLGVRWAADLGWWRGMWFGLFHAVSAFNNAGFDLFGGFKSLTGYAEDAVVTLSITTLIILGGIGFSVIADIYRTRKWRKLSLHSKLVLLVTAILLVAGMVLILLLEWSNTLAGLSPAGKFLAAWFQSVTPRTAGYNTLDIAALHGSTQFLLIVLMFIGASPGSTGGGIKTATFGVLSLAVLSQVAGREDAEIFGRRIPKIQIYKSLAIMFMAVALVMTIAFLLEITEEADFLKVLFETVSAFGTVGLTMGLTPELTTAGRLLIITTMFLGRLGPLTVAFALAQRRKRALIRFPEENIIVG